VSRESSYVFVLPLCLQIADAVVIARYLGATLVLPEIRGDELGKSRYVSGEMMLFYSVLHTLTGGERLKACVSPHQHLVIFLVQYMSIWNPCFPQINMNDLFR
jgi:hypothetical protein